MDGIFVISTTFDTVGAMAKSVDDLATLIGYVQQRVLVMEVLFPTTAMYFSKVGPGCDWGLWI